MSESTTNTDPTAVREWITDQVARYVERDAADIDPDVDLVTYGMDSLRALTLSATIEDEFGLEVDESLAWDHRTVNAITQVLLAELARV
ncbi:Acyl carrier protein [Actinokineospora alba]|uniref:Acyl carrier protein n=1 Tax=Actinokineospora alba TaxID=504798 RepID=A0A1H0HGA4_9PSEU|nr:acyl carrier protein [Actinokineospora alba]TDP64896.1 acyl carrier protein [Actinokineospora alba]SDH48657.1 Acyl carrier protein [Actinokineospora alba]SDO18188.1 Acyl carrier protein [Actinokineospora alba]